jgi:hypothetical protein
MKRILALTILLAVAGPAAAASAAGLAAAMRQAALSDGFEVRLRAVAVGADGRRAAPVKLAVVGRFGVDGQRLMIRGIAPTAVHGRRLFAERAAGGVRAVAADGAAADADAGLFGTALTAWDMLTPWWHWPRQRLGSRDRVAGHACTWLHSRAEPATAGINEVASCVDPQAGIAWRTDFFNSRHALLRSISVRQAMKRAHGQLAAKRFVVTTVGRGTTEVEVYGGDEEYAIVAETFAPLDVRAASEQ